MSRTRFACALLAMQLAASTADASDIVRGGEVYRQHCMNCHGTSGISSWPGAPNLARREGLLQTDQTLLRVLRVGRGAMPGYQGLLSDRDLLNVIAYARTLAQ